mgnify:CR=1 FL=1
MLSREDVENAREGCKLQCQVAALEVIERELDSRSYYCSTDNHSNDIRLQYRRAMPILEEAARSGWFVTWIYRSQSDKSDTGPVEFVIADRLCKPPMMGITLPVEAFTIEPSDNAAHPSAIRVRGPLGPSAFSDVPNYSYP